MKIQILALSEMPDGSLNADIDYDEEAAEHIKSFYGVTEITPDILSRFVAEALHKYIEEEDAEAAAPEDVKQEG
jgi:hypothetical protein